MARFLNPYNFVRPLPAPQNLSSLSDENADLHLLWRCPPPPHDRYTGLSGRITCTMTAKTPVFVSDSDFFYRNEEDEEKKHKTYRFFNMNGQDMIPASSLRGSIRSVFEAATNSTFGAFTFKDEPLYYRWSPDAALGFVPARVEHDESSESGYRLRLLTGMLNLEIGSKNLYAAWIPQYPNPGTKRPKHLLTEIVKIPANLQDGQTKCWAYVVNTKYLLQRETAHENQRKGFPHWQVEYISKTEQEARDWFRALDDDKKKIDQNGQPARYKLVSGYVHTTGLNADVKQYERFFYFNGDEKNTQSVTLTKDDVQRFNSLMSDYHKREDSITNSLDNATRTGIKPSRFVKRLEQLREGTLVYARLVGSNNTPTVCDIYPVGAPRAMYERTIRDVIATYHPYLLPPTHLNELCLASRVFGWISQEGETDLTKEVAYRGRVRFSNAKVTREIKNDEPLTLSILGTPHPTSIEFYLDDSTDLRPSRENAQHGYNNPNAKIRGRKMYRHHKQWKRDEATSSEQSDQNRSIQGIYEANSTWEFTIDFENMQPVELGALLWTLELSGDKQAYHRIGYGKPLGFGSVQIEVTGLALHDSTTRYTAENQIERTQEEQKKQQRENVEKYKPKLVERFQTKISKLYNDIPFAELDNIVDLFALLSGRSDTLPIHYPRLKPNRQAEDNEGFRWFVANRDDKKGKHERLSPAHNDNGLPYNVSQNN